MRIALIGCGSIGSAVTEALSREKSLGRLEVVYDLERERASRLALRSSGVRVAGSLEEVLSSDVDLVVEAASLRAAREVAPKVLEAGKDLLVMSVGAFGEPEFLREVVRLAGEKGRRIYLPSGAVGGLDALKSAAEAELEEVRLLTVKPPKSFAGNRYLQERGVDVEGLGERTVLYDGNALGAIERFPANLNVSVVLSLAGLGVEKTRVQIVADPEAVRNLHEVRVRGTFGEYLFRVENRPMPGNPRTSALAALSAIATLRGASSPLKVGT
jgi:aspartate dehydrogenase